MRQFFYEAREFGRIVLAVWCARHIQRFLWGQPGKVINNYLDPYDWNQWIATIEKRITSIKRDIDPSHKYWEMTAKKRLLQLAGLSIAMIEAIENNAVKPQQRIEQTQPLKEGE